MRIIRISLLSAMITLSLQSATAQTADDIINKHLDAIGGKDKISQVKTIYMEGIFNMMNNQAPSVTYLVHGKGYKNEIDFNGTKMITVYTDKGGWTLNPMAGQTTPTPVTDEVLKIGQAQLDATGQLFDYAAKGNKVELIGKEGDAYHLKVTTPANIETAYYIDGTTYYISKMVTRISANGQQMEMSVENSDFKKTNIGLVMPHAVKLEFVGTGLTITTTSNKIEINKEIDQAIFEMPKK